MPIATYVQYASVYLGPCYMNVYSTFQVSLRFLQFINELDALCEVVPNTLYAMLNGEQLHWEQTRQE